jgi:hypothetical protein
MGMPSGSAARHVLVAALLGGVAALGTTVYGGSLPATILQPLSSAAPSVTPTTAAPESSAPAAEPPPAPDKNAPPQTGDAVPTIKGSDIAQSVTDAAKKQFGRTPDSVTCPDDLPATVGAKVRCTAVAGPYTVGVTVTTTSVRDGRVNYDMAIENP